MKEEIHKKSFEEIYSEICENNKELLENAKRKKRIMLFGIIFFLLIINLIIFFNPETKYFVFGLIGITICIIIFFLIIARKSYEQLYKDTVITALVKSYNERLYYDRRIGITEHEYKMSSFDRVFDKYYSEDRIYGTLKSGANVQIAEIATFQEHEYKDTDGHTKTEDNLTFRGMYGIIRLEKNLGTHVYITEDSMFNRFDKDRIEMDSSEFEKFFDCSSQDKITAMRVFTADLIEKYIDLRRIFKYKLELKIEEDMIYFRYKTGQMFEPPILGTGLDKDTVKKYYDIIYYPLEIIEKTVENINDVME